MNRCPKCFVLYGKKKHNFRTRHHILPSRFKLNVPIYIDLCALCHQQLERMIPFHQREIGFYLEVVLRFLGRIK